MSEKELFDAACARFRPNMQVLIPDSGTLRRAKVDQIVRGVFSGVWGLGLMVWFPGSLHSDAYELSWALKYVEPL